MVKINLMYGDYPRSMNDIYDWLSTNIAPRTLGDTAEDSGPDPRLYEIVYGSVSILEPDEMFMYHTAMYVEFEHDSHAVMFKLALGGHRGSV
jgi:hypothetical protein